MVGQCGECIWFIEDKEIDIPGIVGDCTHKIFEELRLMHYGVMYDELGCVEWEAYD